MTLKIIRKMIRVTIKVMKVMNVVRTTFLLKDGFCMLNKLF